MPPGKGKGGPPSGPPGAVKKPSFSKKPPGPKGPPSGPPGSKPPSSGGGGGGGGGEGGGGLGGLRDEMLNELDRLKKIMRGG